MANFTLSQAQASRLEAAEKNYVDGSFGYWTFRVSGSDGESKFWVDHDTVEGANTASIKAAVLCHMTSSEEFFVPTTPPVVSGSFNTVALGSLS
tara:strand:- start:273 stop:554 length:282 start_codon:yes stop_codon:yes gene_type:complete